MKQRPYQFLTEIALATIAVGTVFYHFMEKWDWVDSLYFSVVTLATVGYGDFAPQTDIGKLFTVVYVLTGVGIIAAFINSLVRRGEERRQKHFDKMMEKQDDNN